MKTKKMLQSAIFVVEPESQFEIYRTSKWCEQLSFLLLLICDEDVFWNKSGLVVRQATLDNSYNLHKSKMAAIYEIRQNNDNVLCPPTQSVG